LVPGQPAWHLPEVKDKGTLVAARKRKQRRMSAQVLEDEDYQLRYEIAAGIDVAKESAVVCVRLPPGKGEEAPDVAPADGAGDGPGDWGARGGADGGRGADGLDGGHLRLRAA
jgi:hypothetical protein